MTQSPLLIVEVWQKKSAEVSSKSKDRLITAVSKGFDAMAAVLSKDSDPEDVHSALAHFNAERSTALKFDKAKDDSLRDLMHGLLESLHVSLNEWTEERNQRMETEDISTQTENSSPVIAIEPKEEPMDDYHAFPHDYQISASELMRDEKMLKEEEMDNENTELGLNFTRSLPLNSVVDPMDISQISPRDNQMAPLNTLRDEMDFKEEEMATDDVTVPRDSMEEDMRLEDVEKTGMGDVVNDSLNEQPFEDDDFLRTIQPLDIIYCQMNFYDKIRGGPDLPLAERYSHNEASIVDVAEAVESEGENGLSANDVIDTEGEEEEDVDHPTDIHIDTSDTVKKEKRRRSSRQVFRPIHYTESVNDSDGDIGPSVKKPRSSSTRKDETMNPVNKKCYLSKMNDTELECPEYYRAWTVRAWMMHLRKKHSTTPALAGLALLCECGNESLSDGHSRATSHCNITVIRKRDGPIRRVDDEKATPQCLLCEFYPKTACGYVFHLQDHHKSTLVQNGVFLKCSCCLEVRSNNFARLNHLDGCNPRQFTLYKLDEK